MRCDNNDIKRTDVREGSEDFVMLINVCMCSEQSDDYEQSDARSKASSCAGIDAARSARELNSVAQRRAVQASNQIAALAI